MMSNLTERLHRNLRLGAILRQVSLRQLVARGKAGINRRIGHLRSRLSRTSLSRLWLALLDRWLGPERGNQFFWNSRLAGNWEATEDRLFKLSEAETPALLRSFIGGTLIAAPGAQTIMFLARSGISREIVADYLRDSALLGPLVARAARSSNFGAGLAAAAAFLLDDEERAVLEARLKPLNLRQSANTALLIDSFATAPAAQPSLMSGTVSQAPSRRPARHRLIIVNNLQNPTRLSLLFAGAEKVTLFSPTNLYGRIKFSAITRLHARPAQIFIAHSRSRATRFSEAYHSLHDETRQIAEEVIDAIDLQAEGRLAEARPYLELHLADALFFRGLRVVGLQALMADPDIDQVMIVGSDTPDDGFMNFFNGVKGLEADPRLEFVSLAGSERARMQFVKTFPQAFTYAEPLRQTLPSCVRPLAPALQGLRAEAAKEAKSFALWPDAAIADTDKSLPRVLFFTSPDSAYNTSSSAYADILIRRFDTLIGLVGSNAGAIFNSTPELPIPPPKRVQLVQTLSGLDATLLIQTVQHVLEQVALRHGFAGTFPVTTQVLMAESAALARATIVPGLYHWERLLHWFSRMSAAKMKPDVVVISPLRPALVGMAAAAARHFAIPSLALEPHIINAEYCRYTRVMTDRYGTVSNYLATLAEQGFSIAANRIDVIGSPRLIATPPVRPDLARQMLTEERLATFPPGRQTLLFFSQPSNWPQISEVWQMILSAMAPHPNLQIMLKVHPEEDGLRVSGYMAIAEAMGLSDRVQSVTAKPDKLIEASDLVLACYSATLVEAALAGRPVMSVVNKGLRYPMDQHTVVGAPQYQDAAHLSAAFAEFSRDPSLAIARLTQFLDANPQFVTGPEPHLRAAIQAIVDADPTSILRPAEDLPPRLFIEGPYQVYEV